MALGLIGTVMAGAAEGAGRSAAPLAKYASDSALQAEAAAVQKARDETLAEIQRQRDERLHGQNVSMEKDVRQPFQREQQQAGFAHAEGMQDRGFEHAESMQGRGFEHAEGMQATQQAFQAEQSELQRNLTREQIASHERVAAGNNAVSLQVAKMGGSVQQDKEGKFFMVGKDGTTKPIMDPNDATKQLSGFKDLSPAAKAYVETIKAQLVDLDRQEIAAAGNQATLTKIGERRAALTREQLNVLTVGIAEAGKGRAPAAEPANRPPLSSFGGPRPATTPAKGGATNGGTANEGPRPNVDAGVSAYGPLTPWDTIEKQARAGDQAAIQYAKERIAKGPGIIGVTPPESLTKFLKGI